MDFAKTVLFKSYGAINVYLDLSPPFSAVYRVRQAYQLKIDHVAINSYKHFDTRAYNAIVGNGRSSSK